MGKLPPASCFRSGFSPDEPACFLSLEPLLVAKGFIKDVVVTRPDLHTLTFVIASSVAGLTSIRGTVASRAVTVTSAKGGGRLLGDPESLEQ